MTRCPCARCAPMYRRGDNLTYTRGAHGAFTCVACGAPAIAVIETVRLAAGDVRCDKCKGVTS